MVKAGEASIAECRQQLKHSEIVANAKLIAAAPDLLKSLKSLCDLHDNDLLFAFAEWGTARDAIRKAIG
jgi:hypothetical protein